MIEHTTTKAYPLYSRVKAHILEQIQKGIWGAAERIPSENALVRDLGVSKMTVNRALRELAKEGYLNRVVGVGSFVAESKVQVHPLEIRNIADEIAERGHQHSSKIEHLAEEKASARLADDLGLAAGSTVFHSIILHLENQHPFQLEDRYVNPLAAPEYLECDFTKITPNKYLTKVAPLQEVEHIVEAQMPSASVARLLDMQPGEPCMVVTRRTWISLRARFSGTSVGSDRIVASGAQLFHPGSTYQLGGRFQPASTGRIS